LKQPKIILGIDPGSNVLGYAFLQIVHKKQPKVVRMDVLDMRKMKKQADKLAFIFNELQKLIKLYEPTSAAIEAPFYGKDVQAMLKLGRAMGAAMVAVANSGLDVEEYSPRSIKKAVTGKGNASKQQLAKMLPHVVRGEIDTQFLDATDALGVAFCHHIQSKGLGLGKKKYSGWDAFLKDNPNRKAKF